MTTNTLASSTIHHFQKRLFIWNTGLILSTVVLMACWYFALFCVGADMDQGNVYRILFVHVPCAWNAFLWVFLGGILSALMLTKSDNKAQAYQIKSQTSMELGTLFSGLALITGSIWGRPTWGVWWDWDPRLTSTLVMFMTCCGYHLLRHFTPDPRNQHRMAAMVAILASVNVPIVYYSVNIWRTLHQPQTFVRKSSVASSEISWTLWTNVLAMILVSVCLYQIRKQALALKTYLERRVNL